MSGLINLFGKTMVLCDPFLVKGSHSHTLTSMSKSTSWFITISPSSLDDVDLKVTQTLTQGYPVYHAILENGTNGVHPHYHIFVEGQDSQRQDSVRRKWSKVCLLDEVPGPFIDVRPTTDKQRLLGQYFAKEECASVLWSTFTDFEIEALRKMYLKAIPDKDKPKTKTILIGQAADKIIGFAKAEGYSLQSRDDMSRIVHLMYMRGFRMGSTIDRAKRVWKEVQMITGQTTDIFDTFM